MENPYNGRLGFSIGRLSSNLETYDESLLAQSPAEKFKQISTGVAVGILGGIIGYIVVKKYK